jgi:hypothetical protein
MNHTRSGRQTGADAAAEPGRAGHCVDGAADGWVLGSWEVVLWANAAGSTTRAKTAIRIKLVRFIVAILRTSNLRNSRFA